MAELKVDKILPATGSSIALGESGKTVVIPSGATLDASAATLTSIGTNVDYCSSLKTSPFTASASRGYFINTGSAVTVTLPSSPSVGDQIIIIDATGNASSNNITLGRNGSKVKGQCKCFALDDDRVGVRIVYSGSCQGWITATSANATAPALCGAAYVAASGGNATITCGNFKTHIFTGSGTLCVSNAGNSIGSNKIDYFVVAGGGSGGHFIGAGGGAGGFRLSNEYSTPAPTMSPLANPTGITATPGAIPVTVGAGAAFADGPTATYANRKGSDSVFTTVTSAGGGGGGFFSQEPGSPVPKGVGGPGGSGGGADYNGGTSTPYGTTNVGGTGNVPPVSPPQGNAGGGSGFVTGGCNYGNGGGGGAGTVGGDGSGCGSPNPLGTAGNGGTGSFIADTIIGPTAPSYGTPGPVSNTRYFAGGGGAGGNAPSPGGTGGTGGGGTGATSPNNPPALNGTANTGGGGGGEGGYPSPGPAAGTGGSGIVIIRYKFQN